MSVRGNSDRRRNRLTAPYESRTTKDAKSNTADNDAKPKPEAALKFLLSNTQCGVLIGNGGSLRRELIEITGADVHFSGHADHYPGTNLRCVYITGSGNAVNLAQALIWEMIGQQTHAVNSGDHSIAWHPSAAKSNPGEHDDVRVEGKITIPASAAGLIVGKGGATIRAIAEESSVELSIDNREDAELTNERVVSMRGTAAGCMNCTYLILSKIAADENDYFYSVNGSTYRSSTAQGRDALERERVGRTTDRSDRRGGGRDYDNDSSGSPRGRRVEVVRPRGGGTTRDDGSDNGRGGRRGGGKPAPIDLSVAAAGVPAEMLRAHTTLELGVPDHLIGAIVGIQGAKLAQIEEMSGAKVTVSKRGEFIKDTNNRLVTIIGTPVSAQTAHTLIIHKLRQEQEEKR
jgi:hypothetical protein